MASHSRSAHVLYYIRQPETAITAFLPDVARSCLHLRSEFPAAPRGATLSLIMGRNALQCAWEGCDKTTDKPRRFGRRRPIDPGTQSPLLKDTHSGVLCNAHGQAWADHLAVSDSNSAADGLDALLDAAAADDPPMLPPSSSPSWSSSFPSPSSFPSSSLSSWSSSPVPALAVIMPEPQPPRTPQRQFGTNITNVVQQRPQQQYAGDEAGSESSSGDSDRLAALQLEEAAMRQRDDGLSSVLLHTIIPLRIWEIASKKERRSIQRRRRVAGHGCGGAKRSMHKCCLRDCVRLPGMPG
jgi:hypothetical protein